MNRLSTKTVSLLSLNIIKERYPMNAKMSNKPYSVEEINTMLDQAEANFAAGLGIPGEVVFRELEEEFAKEEKETQLDTLTKISVVKQDNTSYNWFKRRRTI